MGLDAASFRGVLHSHLLLECFFRGKAYCPSKRIEHLIWDANIPQSNKGEIGIFETFVASGVLYPAGTTLGFAVTTASPLAVNFSGGIADSFLLLKVALLLYRDDRLDDE